MSENPFSGTTRDPIALLEQLIGQVGGLRGHMDVIKQELTQEIGQVKQDLKTIEARQSALEGAVREFQHETSAQLDRIEGIFGHVAKKWMEHDEEIARLKRRQV